jgi:hypothetical protein
MSSIASYKGKVGMQLITIENEEVPIFGAYIQSIGTDYNYSGCIMPVIYVTLNVTTEIYDKIVENATDGKFLLQASIYNGENGGIGLTKEIINDQFIYFIPSKFNFAKKLDDSGISQDVTSGETMHIVVGLMKAELIMANKKSFNGNYVDTNTEELLETIIKDVPGISMEEIDKIENKKEYESFTMIPQESVANALNYLFEDSPFYNTNYNFFMDFKKSYLINSTGDPKPGVPIHTVLFQINSIGGGSENITGVASDSEGGVHIIYVQETDVNYFINTSTEKGANQIVGYDTDEITKTDLNIVVSKESTTNKQAFTKANQLGVDIRKQVMDNTSVTLQIYKMNMDTSMITPDKCYQVNDSKYPDYNGKYLILFKKDIFAKADNDYDVSTIIGLQRIADQ